MARTCLLPNGRPRYRFVGDFDNDFAGRKAVSLAHDIDSNILEYKDVFRVSLIMPFPGSLDPGNVQRTFERDNASYKGLDWELEDLLPADVINAFLSDHPFAVSRVTSVNDKVHREFTVDGKAQLHRFVKEHALHRDLIGVIDVMKTFRYYLGLK